MKQPAPAADDELFAATSTESRPHRASNASSSRSDDFGESDRSVHEDDFDDSISDDDAQQQRMQDMYRSISPRTRAARASFSYDEDDISEMNAREQELLVGIQELQRQLSMVQIQTEKPQEQILPPVADSRRRLIMVSNRLPISFQKNEVTGEWSFKMSSGGLVTALNGIRDEVPFIWIGWLGEEIAHEDQNKVREKLAQEFNCVPVFLSKEIASRYYNDFSNDILWPTFHYVPLPLFKAGSEKKFDFRLWDAYKLANKRFAQAVNQVYREGDYVWVHDYHLMNLPSLLRKRHPKCTIGWFLHTPFPSSEMYRTLPVGKQILQGLLGADLLGFHTYDYARHFLSACGRIPGVSSSPKGIGYEDHFSSVGVFPIGIDPEHFESILESDATQARIKELCAKFAGFKIIIGVDRMDYIKGIPHRMLAMERFLSDYPERRENRGAVAHGRAGVPRPGGERERDGRAHQRPLWDAAALARALHPPVGDADRARGAVQRRGRVPGHVAPRRHEPCEPRVRDVPEQAVRRAARGPRRAHPERVRGQRAVAQRRHPRESVEQHGHGERGRVRADAAGDGARVPAVELVPVREDALGELLGQELSHRPRVRGRAPGREQEARKAPDDGPHWRLQPQQEAHHRARLRRHAAGRVAPALDARAAQGVCEARDREPRGRQEEHGAARERPRAQRARQLAERPPHRRRGRVRVLLPPAARRRVGDDCRGHGPVLEARRAADHAILYRAHAGQLHRDEGELADVALRRDGPDLWAHAGARHADQPRGRALQPAARGAAGHQQPRGAAAGHHEDRDHRGDPQGLLPQAVARGALAEHQGRGRAPAGAPSGLCILRGQRPRGRRPVYALATKNAAKVSAAPSPPSASGSSSSSGGAAARPPLHPEFADASTMMSSALSPCANVFTCHIGANKTERPTDLVRVLRGALPCACHLRPTVDVTWCLCGALASSSIGGAESRGLRSGAG
ncbi:hypothetical protein PybrP1_002498 [[Pythium] brassicae (nom. inval.)]|nr:hypothetical protein PybrP1_002498 [[Pythium] brassicae (nom. inval.)]